MSYKYVNEPEVIPTNEEPFRKELEALLAKYEVHLHENENEYEDGGGEWYSYTTFELKGPNFSIDVRDLAHDGYECYNNKLKEERRRKKEERSKS